MKKQSLAKAALSAVLVTGLALPGIAQAADLETSAEESTTSATGVTAASEEASDANSSAPVDAAGEAQSATPEADTSTETQSAGAATDSSVAPRSATAESAPASTATPAADPAANYTGTVTLVGQWTAESSRKEDTTRQYAAATDKLGAPLPNPGLLRGLGKIFLGWSDQEPDSTTGKVVKGARLFSPEDTVAIAFPNGIPADAKLYGVYFSLNEPNSPIPGDAINLALALIGGMDKFDLNEGTSVTINPHESAEDTLPKTELDTAKSVNGKVIDHYTPGTTNEVVLSSEFTMDDHIAMLVYKNPLASNAILPILSRNYNSLFSSADELNLNTGKIGYTYVDLNVSIPQGITLPEVLNLEFQGYSWRPVYVLNTDTRQPLTIVDPATGADLGNTKTAFSSLVSNTDPNVKFAVKPAGAQNLTVRVMLRHGNAEKISESAVVAAPGKTVAETILQNMTLRAIPSSELPEGAGVVTISDEKARELSLTDGTTTLNVTGSVVGNAVADAGSVGSGWLTMPLRAEMPVEQIDSYPLELGYSGSYKATFEYVSLTPGKDLPQEILDSAPAAQTDLVNGTEVTLPTPAAVETTEGTWTFTSWYLNTVEDANALTSNPTINRANIHLIGGWTFTEHLYKATFEYVSLTPGKDLPQEILDSAPAAQTDLVNGTEVTLPTPAAVETTEGTWTFTSWYLNTVEDANALTSNPTINRANIHLIGGWTFTERERPVDPEKPQPEQPEQPQPADKPGKTGKSSKGGKSLAKTGALDLSGGIAMTFAAGAALLGAGALARRKNRG